MAFKGNQFFSGWVLRSLMFVAGMGFATFVLSQTNKAGDIVLVKGDVFILDKGSKVVADPQGKRGRSTAAGQPFYVGETIQTKPGARVKLKFLEGGNEVVLGSDTSLLIERASNGSDGKKGTTLNLAKGEVRSDVKTKYSGQGGDTYEVKTNNAVAGVRGTVFLMALNAKTGLTQMATTEGKVAFAAVDVKTGKMSPPVIVPAGQFTQAVPGAAAPVAPKPLSENPSLAGQAAALGGSSGGDSGDSGGDNGSSKGSGEQGSKEGEKSGGENSSTEKAPAEKGAEKSADGSSEPKKEPAKENASNQGSGGEQKDSGSQKQTTASNSSDSKSSEGQRAPASESNAAPLGRMTDTASSPGASTPGAGAQAPGPAAPPPPMIMGEKAAPRMAPPMGSIMGSTGVGSAINGAMDAARQATTTVNTLAPPAPPKAIIRIE